MITLLATDWERTWQKLLQRLYHHHVKQKKTSEKHSSKSNMEQPAWGSKNIPKHWDQHMLQELHHSNTFKMQCSRFENFKIWKQYNRVYPFNALILYFGIHLSKPHVPRVCENKLSWAKKTNTLQYKHYFLTRKTTRAWRKAKPGFPHNSPQQDYNCLYFKRA